MKTWYSIKNKSSGVIDITIHDEIGAWGIRAGDFMGELAAQPEAAVINLSIHSPGGSVSDGLAMYNSLLYHPAKVFGTVKGVAASAASFVLMASDHITMPVDSYLNIHNPWAMAMGDAEDMLDMAKLLGSMETTLAGIYAKRVSVDIDTIRTMMKADAWIGAEEALELGFTDTIDGEVGIAAKLDGYDKYFKTLPVPVNDVIIRIDELETIKDLERFLRDVGNLSRKAVTALIAQSKVILPVDPGEPQDRNDATLLDALNKVKAVRA